MEASAAPVPATARLSGGRISPRLLRLVSDERLVAHVRAGSQAAYEVIYDRHHRGILSFCRHMLGEREEAEDAVQHTFMAAYRDLARSEKPIQLRPWLYAIARNRCVSQLRARRERPRADFAEPATEGLASEVQRRADLQDLLRDLAALPEDQRAALVLSEVGDMSHDEISAVIGCPREKVKALVFQARTSLQSSREARDASCGDIRAELSTLTGGALRRSHLRRHVAVCDGCRDFEADVKRQRRAMAAVLPVLPTVALKESALASAFGAGATGAGAMGAAAGAAAGGTVAAGSTSALLAKVLTVAAVASGGSVAGYEAVTDSGPEPRENVPAAAQGASRPADASTPPAAPEGEAPASSRRPAGSERGRELARTRGGGRKRGLLQRKKPAQGSRPAPGSERSQTARRRAADRRESNPRAAGRRAAPPREARVRPAPPAARPALEAAPPAARPPAARAPAAPGASAGGQGKGKGKP